MARQIIGPMSGRGSNLREWQVMDAFFVTQRVQQLKLCVQQIALVEVIWAGRYCKLCFESAISGQ